MVVSKISLLIFRQIIPVISSAFISQFVLSSDVEKENDRANHTQPYQSESESKSEWILWCLIGNEHVAKCALVANALDRDEKTHDATIPPVLPQPTIMALETDLL